MIKLPKALGGLKYALKQFKYEFIDVPEDVVEAAEIISFKYKDMDVNIDSL